MKSFSGKTVIITGGGAGIGAAYSREFAAEGASVVVADISEDAAQAIAKEIDGLAVKVDVSDESSTQAMAKAAHDRFGRIDILINNAALWTAILPMKPWTEISVQEWDRVMSVNVRGCFLTSRAVFPYMKNQNWGRIINIASNTAFAGTPGVLHYASSKGAVMSFNRSLAREVAEFGITVNAIAPGLVSTEETKKHFSQANVQTRVSSRAIKREQTPNDLIGGVMFLASERASFITGQVLTIDGGNIMH